jgi:hypothetical protein
MKSTLSVHNLLPLAYGHCAEGFGMWSEIGEPSSGWGGWSDYA